MLNIGSSSLVIEFDYILMVNNESKINIVMVNTLKLN